MSDIVQVAPTPATFQSRWGYHPCSAQTAKKLRRLNFLGYEARRREAAWLRWDAKLPENRRIFVGGPPGYEGVKKNQITKTHRVYKPWPEPRMFPVTPLVGSFWFFNEVLVASRDARHPKSAPENVRPMTIPLDKIDKVLEAMEKWWAEPRSFETA